MQRYFINENLKDKENLIIDKEALHHIKKVMRNKNGDQVICIDKQGINYYCEIIDIDHGTLKKLEAFDNDSELDVDVTLIYALPKGDKFELVLQKATELGVTKIVPLISKRCVVKTNQEKFSRKLERYQKIVKEASEQSKRNLIPKVDNIITLDKLNEYTSDYNLVAYEEVAKAGKHFQLKETLSKLQAGNSITVVVGSEGGFDEEEVIKMQEMGYLSCSLGKRILRSETAPLYILSTIGFVREIML